MPRPGQFNMLYAFGVGEVPISTSADPATREVLTHTIRDVGAVSHALVRDASPATVLGVRGPYGDDLAARGRRGRDLVIVAGGIGLAPLRPAIHEVLAQRDEFDAVCVLVGARTPADLLFAARARALARPLRRRPRGHGRHGGAAAGTGASASSRR